MHFSLNSCLAFGFALLTIERPFAARCEQAQAIFTAPNNQLSILSMNHERGIYGRAKNLAKWHISQWNNPSGDIADFHGNTAANASLTVTTTPNDKSIEIYQSGLMLACINKGTVQEFDGLVGTNTADNNPALPAAEATGAAKEPLSTYRTLRQQIDLAVEEARPAGGTINCPISKAVSLVCVVLNNREDNTTLFLQTILFAFNTRPHSGWWSRGAKGSRFGYNFVLPVATPSETGGAVQHFDIDVLDRIRSLIQNNRNGLDTNLRNWYISGAYFGNAVYGSVAIRTEWNAYKLLATF